MSYYCHLPLSREHALFIVIYRCLREHVLELEHAAARDSERQEASVEEMKRTTADLTAEKVRRLVIW